MTIDLIHSGGLSVQIKVLIARDSEKKLIRMVQFPKHKHILREFFSKNLFFKTKKNEIQMSLSVILKGMYDIFVSFKQILNDYLELFDRN